MKAGDVLLFAIICIVTLADNTQQPYFDQQEIKRRCYTVHYFYRYRKYVNNEKTDRSILCAVYQDSIYVSLRPTDRGFNNPEYPSFVSSYDFALKDSSIIFILPKGYSRKILDFNASPGDTIISGRPKNYYYLEDKGEYAPTLTYYLIHSLRRRNPAVRIKYVHNMGFVSEERIYNDSIVKWELESISGTPLAEAVEEDPDFGYFYTYEE